jgi:hypothetical protein
MLRLGEDGDKHLLDRSVYLLDVFKAESLFRNTSSVVRCRRPLLALMHDCSSTNRWLMVVSRAISPQWCDWQLTWLRQILYNLLNGFWPASRSIFNTSWNSASLGKWVGKRMHAGEKTRSVWWMWDLVWGKSWVAAAASRFTHSKKSKFSHSNSALSS